VKAFHAYVLLGGDAKRVAALFRCEESTIVSLAHDFNWKQQVTLARMDSAEGLTEQQQLHRVGVFIVAERAKKIFTDLFERLENDEAFAEAMTTKLSPDGAEVNFDAKNLLDLVKGFQALTEVSYRALGEGLAKDAEKGEGVTAAASIAVYEALRNRFDKMVPVDTTTSVSRALKDVTPL
jgi:hypothetical protein